MNEEHNEETNKELNELLEETDDTADNLPRMPMRELKKRGRGRPKGTKSGPTAQTLASYPKIVEGLSQNKSMQEVAESVGLKHVQSLQRRIRYPEFQHHIMQMVADRTQQCFQWIEELYYSGNPTSQRSAVSNLVAMIKTFYPKTSYHKMESYRYDVRDEIEKRRIILDNKPELRERLKQAWYEQNK